MNEQLTLLIQLQEIDGRIRAQQDEKKRIPEQLASFEQRVLANKAELDKVRDSLENAQKIKRDRDQDLDEGGRKVEKLKSRTSEIKTNKEYQALLKEIETAEQENRLIEDDILRLMEQIDAAAAEIKNAERRSADEDAAIQEDRRRLEKDREKIDANLAEVERLRDELLARIDAAVLAEYRRLAGITGGKVVVEARGESCSGCYMSIPPRTFVNVKKNDSIIACPHCQRILYYKEAIVQSNT
jgi:predicted  nucleic acid-binding Zn-ribbon protein